MIEDYDNDAKMAEAGRRSVKWKAINSAKENLRDIAVSLGNSGDAETVKLLREEMAKAINNLLVAMELK